MSDAIVIGSGPNGLVAANLLVDAGWSVTVLEAAGEPGGAVRTGELTLPGFQHDLFSAFYPLAAGSPVFRALGLERHGLRWCHAPLALAHPLPDGRCASLSTDEDVTATSLDSFGNGEGDAWRRMMADWDRVADPVMAALFRPFPPLGAAARLAGRLGVIGSLRLIRHFLLPVRRMAEELFGGEGGGLLLGGNALHADLAPEAAGSGAYGWLLSCLGQRVGFPVPEGGAGQLSGALADRLQSRGGSICCHTTAVEVVVRQHRAVAVRTETGETVDARRAVLADVAAPALYGSLVAKEHLPGAVMDDLNRFHWDAATVKVDWALDGPLPWLASDARRAGTVHVADDFDNFTEYAAHLAMGRLPHRPFLIVGQQSIADPTRSPPGNETAWGYTHVPRRIRGDAGGTLAVDGPRSWIGGFVDRMEERIESLAPGFRSLILERHVFGPEELESEDANLDGGALNGGTSQPHQQFVFRPVPGAGRPETPIAGLYLASASAHPGGGVHGAAGANAARTALLPAPMTRSVLLGRGPWKTARRGGRPLTGTP